MLQDPHKERQARSRQARFPMMGATLMLLPPCDTSISSFAPVNWPDDVHLAQEIVSAGTLCEIASLW